jgi:hypothetical protein
MTLIPRVSPSTASLAAQVFFFFQEGCFLDTIGSPSRLRLRPRLFL